LSMAMDDDHFVGTFKVKGEAGRSWFVGHRLSLIRKRCDMAGRGSREFLIRRLGGVENSERLKSTMVMLEPGLTDSKMRVQLLWNHCSN
jgi:hypothetical protein